mmetsp:Transcript_102402/g.319004  ORF Transcript_102402/g.319004 Transcript_102402/m.319004 type:complete len:360 (+) Transcript_102402:159-1238(+)
MAAPPPRVLHPDVADHLGRQHCLLQAHDECHAQLQLVFDDVVHRHLRAVLRHPRRGGPRRDQAGADFQIPRYGNLRRPQWHVHGPWRRAHQRHPAGAALPGSDPLHHGGVGQPDREALPRPAAARGGDHRARHRARQGRGRELVRLRQRGGLQRALRHLPRAERALLRLQGGGLSGVRRRSRRERVAVLGRPVPGHRERCCHAHLHTQDAWRATGADREDARAQLWWHAVPLLPGRPGHDGLRPARGAAVRPLPRRVGTSGWVLGLQPLLQHIHHACDQARVRDPLVPRLDAADAPVLARLQLVAHHGQRGDSRGFQRLVQLVRHPCRPHRLPRRLAPPEVAAAQRGSCGAHLAVAKSD